MKVETWSYKVHRPCGLLELRLCKWDKVPYIVGNYIAKCGYIRCESSYYEPIRLERLVMQFSFNQKMYIKVIKKKKPFTKRSISIYANRWSEELINNVIKKLQ